MPVEIGGAASGAGGKGAAGEEDKVHVHLMEGADRVASYVVDLSPPSEGGGEGSWSERNDTRLTFLFRVDDGGVPSVESARCVLTFREISHIKIHIYGVYICTSEARF